MKTLTLLTATFLISLASAPMLAGASGPTTWVVGVDAPTIQATVDLAAPGDSVRIPGGFYQEAVQVDTPDLFVYGDGIDVTILDGAPGYGAGISVSADRVNVSHLTVQNYRSNGIVFSNVEGFGMYDLHARNNYGYGLYAIHSTHGDISYSSGEGQGDSAIYIGETPFCDCDVHHNRGWNNMLGYSGTANSHLRIYENEFFHNRAGILMSVLPNEAGVEDDGTLYGTQVGTHIYRNYVHDNNNQTRTIGTFETIHPPIGEGITIAGGWNNHVYENILENNDYCGTCVFWLSTPARGNAVYDNIITDSRYGVWWDEFGEDNCWDGNVFGGNDANSDPATLPPCTGLLGGHDASCAGPAAEFAACRGAVDTQGAHAPSAPKLANLALRALCDLQPYEDPQDDLGCQPTI